MSRYIIGIHGLLNKPPYTLLEKWWELALREGLERIGQPKHKIPFDLIYWADEMYPKPLDPGITDPEHEEYISERYHWGVSADIEDISSNLNKLRRYLEKQLHQILLNPDLSLNYEKITDKFLQHFFKDLNKYFSTVETDNVTGETARVKIQKRVLEMLDQHSGDSIILIAHSMGSIIAYDVMTRFPERCSHIDMLITIGSPLGLPVIQGKLASGIPAEERSGGQLKTPSSLKGRWLNFSDPEDTVAFDQLLSDDYGPNNSSVHPEDILIFNDYVNEGDRNPHKSYGYLRSRAIAEVIDEFLRPQSGYFKPLFDKAWFWLTAPLKRLRKRWNK
ncbi:MAG: hypothetical protein HQ506_00185 [Candidatus Marinimicrobia bacterium]|nr:hypothetical protein [Candidatus Neomarinimicrobiota bacterium]